MTCRNIEHKLQRKRRVWLSVFCALATMCLVLAGTCLGSVASAQGTGTAPAVNQTQVSLIDPAKTANLTIWKKLGDPTNQPNNGTPQSVNLPDYEASFTVQRITNLDPTNIADWEKYSKLDVNDATLQLEPVSASNTVTTTGGKATLANLPLGFYKVVELPQVGSPDVSRTTIAPFLVALPMTDLAPQADPTAPTPWRYDVHVYPKNQELKVKKTVQDQGKQLGDTVSYTIAADIPAPPTDAAQTIASFQIVDRWEKNEIAPDLNSVQVFVGATQLTSGVDYSLSPITDPADFPGYSQFEVTLTSSGLKIASDAQRNDPSAQVSVKLNAKIVGVGGTDAQNQAHFTPPTGKIVISTVLSKYGKIQLQKLNGVDKTTKLAGATFELYRCGQGTTELIDPQKITVNGQTSWTTGADGLALIDGVQLEDWANGAQFNDTFDYCVIETKAPSGYELNPKPINVSITQATPMSADNYYLRTQDVFDYPTNGGFRLPETGAAGVAGLIAGGALIVALAVAMNRRKAGRAEQQLLG